MSKTLKILIAVVLVMIGYLAYSYDIHHSDSSETSMVSSAAMADVVGMSPLSATKSAERKRAGSSSVVKTPFPTGHLTTLKIFLFGENNRDYLFPIELPRQKGDDKDIVRSTIRALLGVEGKFKQDGAVYETLIPKGTQLVEVWADGPTIHIVLNKDLPPLAEAQVSGTMKDLGFGQTVITRLN